MNKNIIEGEFRLPLGAGDRQMLGLDRRVKLPRRPGWFTRDIREYSGRIAIETTGIDHVFDLSNVRTQSLAEEPFFHSPGSFGIVFPFSRVPRSQGVFTFVHPEDIAEALHEAGVTNPGELTGKIIKSYSIKNSVVGIRLL